MVLKVKIHTIASLYFWILYLYQWLGSFTPIRRITGFVNIPDDVVLSTMTVTLLGCVNPCPEILEMFVKVQLTMVK